MTAPLRELTRQDTPWHWDTEKDKSLQRFESPPDQFSHNDILGPRKTSELLVDTSPVDL